MSMYVWQRIVYDAKGVAGNIEHGKNVYETCQC